MRREYPNGFVRALRWAATMSNDADELLDAADEIERLRTMVVLAYQAAYSRGHEDTVEGCVNVDCINETTCADEFIEEQDALAGKEDV